ncbi:MAG: glycosyltransferase [Myxococcaceae bacterium]|nr:glycosyltransferase [Myxococcaceae bacterium]MBH2006786.1 glycosyltransferase [Myxococcaceae bacterium]
MTYSPGLVSVIIPYYKKKRRIIECIKSILNQRHNLIEIIVIDDGSEDDLIYFLKEINVNLKLIKQFNCGPSSARNAGISASQGEYLKFLDADDFLLDQLKEEVEFSKLLKNNEFSVGCSLKLSEASGVISPHSRRDALSSYVPNGVELALDAPLISAPLWPRYVIQNLGGFREDITYREDYEFFMRAILSGYKPVFIPLPVFVYCDYQCDQRVSRQLPKATSKQQLKIFKGLIFCLQGNSELSLDIVLNEALSAAAWQAARILVREGSIQEAALLFRLSRELSHGDKIVGQWQYQLACRILGPIAAEQFLTKARKLVNKMLSLLPN